MTNGDGQIVGTYDGSFLCGWPSSQVLAERDNKIHATFVVFLLL